MVAWVWSKRAFKLVAVAVGSYTNYRGGQMLIIITSECSNKVYKRNPLPRRGSLRLPGLAEEQDERECQSVQISLGRKGSQVGTFKTIFFWVGFVWTDFLSSADEDEASRGLRRGSEVAEVGVSLIMVASVKYFI